MNNRDMARSYLKQAAERLSHAKESRSLPFIVRQSQEVVELSLKASLRMVGGRAAQVARRGARAKASSRPVP